MPESSLVSARAGQVIGLDGVEAAIRQHFPDQRMMHELVDTTFHVTKSLPRHDPAARAGGRSWIRQPLGLRNPVENMTGRITRWLRNDLQVAACRLEVIQHTGHNTLKFTPIP